MPKLGSSKGAKESHNAAQQKEQFVRWLSDGKKVSGPRVDMSYTAQFNIGEYQRVAAGALVMIPDDAMLEVTVRVVQEGEDE